jgi:sulfate/thiosulfate transport system substrate-binding protein
MKHLGTIFTRYEVFGIFLLFGLVGVSAGVIITSQSQFGRSHPKTIEITLASFAVTRAAYEHIIPKFVQKWKAENGGEVIKFRRSYGGSGSQARAIIDGLDADVVHLALALDTNRIQKAGLIESGWQARTPNNGIVAKTVVAIAVRPGNPKNIKEWLDLSKPGIQLITANPKTSGVARWNFLGLWAVGVARANLQEFVSGMFGNQIGASRPGIEVAAKKFVISIYKNVSILPRDAREATDAFLKQGQGDALLNYENEFILAAKENQEVTYIVPERNISIDTPVAVVDRNIDRHGTRKVSEAFVKYLFTPESQREFAKVGFRPVLPAIAKEYSKQFRPVKKLSTVDDFGGWEEVQQKFFADTAIFDQIRSKLAKRN